MPTLLDTQDPSLEVDNRRTDIAAADIALSMVAGAQRLRKSLPTVAHLQQATTAIDHEGHIAGGDALKVTLRDEGFLLLDSGFFSSTNKQGRLDPLDLTYPPDTRFGWRLTTVSPSSDETVVLTFADKAAAVLMGLHGPLKAQRGAMTRARFLQMLCRKAGVSFYSLETDSKQPIDVPKVSAPTSSNTGAPQKTAGIGANAAGLQVKGSAINSLQTRIANAILAVGNQLGAPQAALEASMYAAMGESSLGKDNGGSNVFQTTGVPSAYGGGSDYAGQARGFFTGGTSFGSPGAIKAAQRGDPVWQIANETEVNKVWLTSKGDSYGHQWPGGQAQGLKEAAALVGAGGGALGSLPGGSTIETIQPYFFQVGTNSAPHEDYWTAMQRLAQEVAWALFTDGDRVYYDSQPVLARQKPAAVIGRDDPAVVDWNYDWETRNIATQMTLKLLCDPFQFRPGEVFQLEEFGPASDMSTVGLPGRWLIGDIQRGLGDLVGEFTLIQPTAPKPEPAPQVTSRSVGGAGTSASSSVGGINIPAGSTGVLSALAAAKRLSDYAIPYSQAHRQLTDPPQSGGYDCSASTAWVLWKANMYGGPTSWAWVSGEFASSWGQPGRGREMTVWANSGHVFIEFNVPGVGHYQINTVNPGGGGTGPRLIPWSYSNVDAGDGATHGNFVPRHWPGT